MNLDDVRKRRRKKISAAKCHSFDSKAGVCSRESSFLFSETQGHYSAETALSCCQLGTSKFGLRPLLVKETKKESMSSVDVDVALSLLRPSATTTTTSLPHLHHRRTEWAPPREFFPHSSGRP